MTLNELKTGEKANITQLKTQGSMRRRLQELGFLKGNYISCVMKSPLKDPVAYKICGAVIAIRNEDAKNVIIERSVTDGTD